MVALDRSDAGEKCLCLVCARDDRSFRSLLRPVRRPALDSLQHPVAYGDRFVRPSPRHGERDVILGAFGIVLLQDHAGRIESGDQVADGGRPSLIDDRSFRAEALRL